MCSRDSDVTVQCVVNGDGGRVQPKGTKRLMSAGTASTTSRLGGYLPGLGWELRLGCHSASDRYGGTGQAQSEVCTHRNCSKSCWPILGRGQKSPTKWPGFQIEASASALDGQSWEVDAPVTFTKYVPAVKSEGRVTWPWTLFKVPAKAPVRVTMRTLKVCVVGRAKVTLSSEGLG